MQRFFSSSRIVFGFAAILIGSFLLHLWILAHNGMFLVTHVLPDDAYYYFQLAKQAALGHGSTFDGIHATNGYHPLWMWLITGLTVLFHSNLEQPLYATLLVASVLDLGIIASLYFLLRRYPVSEKWSLLGAAIYAFNPWAIAHSLNGMESILANACLCFALVFAVLFLSAERKPQRFLIPLSLLAVCTILARIDYALHIGVLGLVIFFGDPRSWKKSWYVSALVPGGLLLAGWMFAWWQAFHSIIPQSGFAFTEVNRVLFFYKARSLGSVVLWGIFQWFQSIRLAAQTSGMSWLLWGIVGGFLIRQGYLAKTSKTRPAIVPLLLLSLIGSFTLYTFVQGALRWSGREWYFTLGPVLASLCLVPLLILVSHYKRAGIATAILMGSIVLCFIFTNPLRGARFIHQLDIFQAAQDISHSLPPRTKIGMFNAGVLGYYSSQTIVNLDGVVNTSAYQALHDHNLYAYLQAQQIPYVLDYEIAVSYRYFPFWGTKDTSFLVSERDFGQGSAYHNSQLRLYRVIK